jgi:hypothetical protein
MMRRRLLIVLFVAGVLVGAGGIPLLREQPSGDRDRIAQQARVPAIAFNGDVVRIRNVRNTDYRTADDYDVRYDDRTYDLDRIERVWLALAAFGDGWRGPAHIFLSFEFVRMLTHAQQLEQQPEFYHTLFHNCTTNIVRPVNEFATNRIRWGWQVLLPGYSDDLAYGMGLIDADGSLEEVRARHRINERAQAAWGSGDFSARIRGG